MHFLFLPCVLHAQHISTILICSSLFCNYLISYLSGANNITSPWSSDILYVLLLGQGFRNCPQQYPSASECEWMCKAVLWHGTPRIILFLFLDKSPCILRLASISPLMPPRPAKLPGYLNMCLPL
jgi:hypothetical protein